MVRGTVTKSVDRGTVMPRTKTGTKHVRHIPEVLFSTLARHHEISLFKSPGDFVFCKRDGTVCDPDMIRDTVLYPAIDRAGIERSPRASGFHAFRHAGSCIINHRTGDLKLSQIQLGHQRITTTADIYTHNNMLQVERAGEVLADAIFGHQMSTKSLVDVHQRDEESDANPQVQ
jgi:integrase